VRLQLELFGTTWVFVSEVSPTIGPEEDQIVEAYSHTGFSRNEEEDEGER
jgi:hypothetical protein